MKLADIQNSITTLSGIGPAAAKLFAKLNVFSVADLLTFYPKDYEDRTQRVPLASYRTAKVHCAAVVTAHEWFGYGKMKTLKLLISDGVMDAALVAFNRPFLENQFPPGTIISVSGAFDVKYGALQSTSFEIVKLSDSGDISEYAHATLPDSRVLPLYPLTEGLNQKNVRKAIATALREYGNGIENELPENVIHARSLHAKRDAIKMVHMPKTIAEAQEARRTLIYEELFHFQYTIAQRAWEHKGDVPDASITSLHAQNAARTDDNSATQELLEKEFAASLSPLQTNLYKHLPFKLTSDQMRVIMEMGSDVDRGYRERAQLEENMRISGNVSQKKNAAATRPVFTMARLLQGDVGSGKTLVAFFLCLRIISWKGQCAFMAPTELLAQQHAETASKLLEPLGIRVAFLTGNVKAKGRSELIKQLKAGNIDIVIGTHALFSQAVQYNDLQLAVIDEQHRFGVLQRQAIIEKGRKIAGMSSYTLHLLMMSATPIPQTLALTVFGDLDVSTLRSMPQGRKPIATYLVREGNESNAYEAVRKELAAGHQAYFVYPAIETDERNETAQRYAPHRALESSTEKSALKAAEEMFAFLRQHVYPEFTCALIHSRIDEDEQAKIIRAFREGSVQVLAATTVIEVGVDVPNATCIVIEQADRFGLAALHQLRGRVGRGNEQSYCFLIYRKDITEAGIARMKALRESTDGFYIAEQDLQLRGPGEVTGTLQAGNLQLGIADIHRDRELLLQARNDAFSQLRNILPMRQSVV
ncbi:MAG: ATP-dependent DNA helicase RecG [Treponema sp.]|nr:ATP-dependent DNA helicase RecG [Treponema sp.]